MAAAVRERRASATELVEAHVARLEALNGDLNAIVVPDLDRALAAARTEALAKEGPRGPLHGVPQGAARRRGPPLARGVALFAEVVPTRDAPAVARLRAAGGILLGKTNMSELALFPDSVNRVYGATRNPRDISRSAGGSSGGEACAVAAGLSPLGIGGDYGGSIRCPAHFCGVAGLRAGAGSIPTSGGGLVRWAGVRGELSTLGPLARTVEDLELAYQVLGRPGADPALPPGVTVFADGRGRSVDARCDEAVRRASADLAAAGLRVDEATPPFQEELEAVFDALTAAETQRTLGALLPGGVDDVTPQTSAVWASVEHVRTTAGDEAVLRTRLREIGPLAAGWLARHPILLAPAAAEPAYEVGRIEGVFDLFAHCKLASALGLPAAIVPVPGAGLPVGVQLVGRRRHERQLLRVARLLESTLR